MSITVNMAIHFTKYFIISFKLVHSFEYLKNLFLKNVQSLICSLVTHFKPY